METVAREWISAGQPFVEQQRQSLLIRQLRRECQRVIRFHAPVHLRPVKNVARALPRLAIVQFPDAFHHLNEMIKERMRFLNRAKLLWSYLLRRERVPALPVEYIVETTAKCNLYCPMCPRETHPQPKEDMNDAVFDALVKGAARTGEHMMLIGLGEPFLDPKIFDRIEYCERHGISTLLSTNGVLLDEVAAEKLLATPLAHITLSFDGASKESFEMYRKGAKFERVRDNFVRLRDLETPKKGRRCRLSCRWSACRTTPTKWRSSSASGARCRASIRCGLRRTRPMFCNRKPREPAQDQGLAIICGAARCM